METQEEIAKLKKTCEAQKKYYDAYKVYDNAYNAYYAVLKDLLNHK
jgi:hypothetical protein